MEIDQDSLVSQYVSTILLVVNMESSLEQVLLQIIPTKVDGFHLQITKPLGINCSFDEQHYLHIKKQS
jgi:hypothetical protein